MKRTQGKSSDESIVDIYWLISNIIIHCWLFKDRTVWANIDVHLFGVHSLNIDISWKTMIITLFLLYIQYTQQKRQ